MLMSQNHSIDKIIRKVMNNFPNFDAVSIIQNRWNFRKLHTENKLCHDVPPAKRDSIEKEKQMTIIQMARGSKAQFLKTCNRVHIYLLFIFTRYDITFKEVETT